MIGICAVHEPARWSFWDQPAHLVADSYVAAVQRAGAVALLLPVDGTHPTAALLECVHGLLLIGGADIDPALYGAERDVRTEATYPDRDAFELALLHGAIAAGMPVLGICRGMQLINVALGGTLRQHLGGKAGSNPHRRRLGSFEGTEHTIAIEPGSLAAHATGEEVHLAHCHHHQGVDTTGDGLRVTARADDGLPEALELESAGWVLGVQWHPEADERSRVFAAFTAAATWFARSRAKGPDLTPIAERGISSTGLAGSRKGG